VATLRAKPSGALFHEKIVDYSVALWAPQQNLKRGTEGVCGDVSTLLWKWMTASSSEKGKNYNLSAKIISYGPVSNRMEISPANPLFFLFCQRARHCGAEG
jgi:hypothetical protein